MTDLNDSGEGSAEGEFAPINLRRWPFDVVPSSEGVERWLGRPDLGKRLRRLVVGAVRVPTSRIVLIWATFGSGKTHALRHLQYLARSKGSPLAAYIVVPRGIKSFMDIYRAIIDALRDQHSLETVGQEILRAHGPNVETDSERALVRLAVGSPEERRLTAAWLRGEKLPVRDVRTLGLTRRVETATDAVQILNDVIAAIYKYRSPVVLLLDEVQELEELGKKLPECVGGLHKLFDLNPRGLTFIFSFTTGSRTALRSILGEALYDRASDVLPLPPLSAEEGIDFVEAVIGEWSLDESLAPTPFTRDAVRAVVEALDREEVLLTPRVLMKTFDRILRDGEFDISEGEIQLIGEDYALQRFQLMTQEDFA